MLELIDNRASTELEKEIIAELRRANKLFNTNLEYILRQLQLPYAEFTKLYLPEIEKITTVCKNTIQTDGKEDVLRYTGSLDNIWALHNGNVFVMNVSSIDTLPEVTDISDIDFDGIADCYVNFTTVKDGKRKYLNYYISLLKDIEPVNTISKKGMACYAIAVGGAGNRGIDYQVRFTKELYPRLLKDSEPNKCRNCASKNIIELGRTFEGEELKGAACLIGKTSRNSCFTFRHPLNPQIAINIFAYIAKIFADRHRLTRKNSKLREQYKDKPSVNILATKIKETDSREVPLLLYAKNESEYRARTGTKHASHASPREHIRREHVRHLKSGKTVVVRGSIVNKGREKTIYQIK